VELRLTLDRETGGAYISVTGVDRDGELMERELLLEADLSPELARELHERLDRKNDQDPD
jgi:hypothetical protein